MTHSKAKQVNQVMGLLFQSIIDEMMIVTRNEASSMLGSKVGNEWINLIHVDKVGGKKLNFVTVRYRIPCARMVVTRISKGAI